MVAHVGDRVGTGADGQEGVAAADDGLVGVVGVQMQAAAAEDLAEDVTWSGNTLTRRSTDADGVNAGTRPGVGLIVTTPLAKAGTRSEPPMSLP